MTIRLRAHHLLCILTYAGAGYSRAFTDNYDAIVTRLAAGEEVALVEGPDDICAPELDATNAHCRRESVLERDELAGRSLAQLIGRPIVPGARLNIDGGLIVKLRRAFKKGGVRAACTGCEWFSFCTEVAGADYRGVRLRGQVAS